MSLVRFLRQPFRGTVLPGIVSLRCSASDGVPLALPKGEVFFTRHLTQVPSVHHRQNCQTSFATPSQRVCTNLGLPFSHPFITDSRCTHPLGRNPPIAILCQFYSSEADKSQAPKPGSPGTSGNDKKEGEVEAPQSIFQRFKEAYKQHGKVLVGVHIATSLVWFSIFYYTAYVGLDVVPVMERVGLPESVISPFREGGLGDIAVAYLLYKLFTPARYTVTLAGTNYVIKYLRRTGKMEPVKQGEKLRDFYKEGKDKVASSKLREERLERLKNLRAKRQANKRQK